MVTSGELTVRAPAKINLGLAVLGRRPDGFHDIDTLFARLELGDELRLRFACPAPSTHASGPADTRSPVQGLDPSLRFGSTFSLQGSRLIGDGELDLQGLRMDEENLAMRAATAYLKAANKEASARDEGVLLELIKRIPLAAGLGGGSSDAAATLLGLARLFPADIDLGSLGAGLGSDVPFFLSGWGAAWAGGRGELLEKAELTPLPVVLVKPRVSISASEAYSRVDHFKAPLQRSELLERLKAGEEPGYRNDLQQAVAAAHPEVAAALQALRGAGLRGVLMSGSGSTCFGIAGSAAAAADARRELGRRHPDWWLWSGLAGV